MLINWINRNNMLIIKTRVKVVEIRVKTCIYILRLNPVSSTIFEQDATFANNFDIQVTETQKVITSICKWYTMKQDLLNCQLQRTCHWASLNCHRTKTKKHTCLIGRCWYWISSRHLCLVWSTFSWILILFNGSVTRCSARRTITIGLCYCSVPTRGQ